MRIGNFLFFVLIYGQLQAQGNGALDFLKIEAEIFPRPLTHKIEGKATYTFQVKARTDSVFLDAIAMEFGPIRLNQKKLKYAYNGKRLGFKAPKKVGIHTIALEYRCVPEQTVYFMGWDDAVANNEQIWTQGQGKYTSHWLPSFDDMTEKVEMDLSIVAPKNLEVIANGLLKSVDSTALNTNIWMFDMQRPMSSYLTAFVIGDFGKTEIRSASGVPIYLYYRTKDSARVEPTYRYTKAIFDFLENEVAVPYPWQNYKMVPVHDFLYAGMENTGCTLFSDQYVIDSVAFVDKNFVNVNAHEMAHQWFGDLVTETNGEHHWLHEGFATYYAYMAEKELFGAEHYFWKLWETAQTLHQLTVDGKGESLLDPKAGSLTFYEKGAWAMAMLKKEVGEEAFKKGIAAYLNTFAYKNATVTDFLTVMQKASGKDLSIFKRTWLQSSDFPWETAKQFLTAQSPSIKMYFEEVHKEGDISWLKESLPVPYKLALMEKYQNTYTPADHSLFLSSEELKVRQKSVQLLQEIPASLQALVENLLADQSYVTQETALFKLWSAFSEKRSYYLERTKNTVGLPNRNVRLLWLTLALLTPEYAVAQKGEIYDQLVSYTTAEHHFEVRQLAFQYLYQIQAMDNRALIALMRSADHHAWQFRNYCRQLLDELLKDQAQQKRILELSKQLKDTEISYVKRRIDRL